MFNLSTATITPPKVRHQYSWEEHHLFSNVGGGSAALSRGVWVTVVLTKAFSQEKKKNHTKEKHDSLVTASTVQNAYPLILALKKYT